MTSPWQIHANPCAAVVSADNVRAELGWTCCLSFGGNKRSVSVGQILAELERETGWPYETLHCPGEMNSAHKTYKVLPALIFHDGPQTPALKTL